MIHSISMRILLHVLLRIRIVLRNILRITIISRRLRRRISIRIPRVLHRRIILS